MIRTAVALVLALSGALGGAVDPDPFACPEPGEPNCGEANGAGGWEPDPVELEAAPPAAAVDVAPTFTG